MPVAPRVARLSAEPALAVAMRRHDGRTLGTCARAPLAKDDACRVESVGAWPSRHPVGVGAARVSE